MVHPSKGEEAEVRLSESFPPLADALKEKEKTSKPTVTLQHIDPPKYKVEEAGTVDLVVSYAHSTFALALLLLMDLKKAVLLLPVLFPVLLLLPLLLVALIPTLALGFALKNWGNFDPARAIKARLANR